MNRVEQVARKQWPFLVAVAVVPGATIGLWLSPASDAVRAGGQVAVAAVLLVIWVRFRSAGQQAPPPVDLRSVLGLRSPKDPLAIEPAGTAASSAVIARGPVRTLLDTTGVWDFAAPRGRRANIRGVLLWLAVAVGVSGSIDIGFDGQGWRIAKLSIEGCLVLLGIGVGIGEYLERARRPFGADGLLRPAYDSGFLWVTVPIVLSTGAISVALIARHEASAIGLDRFLRLVLLTCLCEEAIYRIMLLSWGYRAFDPRRASMLVAASFGLSYFAFGWIVSRGVTGAPAAQRWAFTGVVVVIAFAAGVLANWMRLRTRGVYGPLMLHLAITLPGLALSTQLDWTVPSMLATHVSTR